jgi:hypothetical protein
MTGEIMRIKIENEIFDWINQASEIEGLFTVINQKLEEMNFQLSHLLIDGIPVYGNYYDYFINKIDTIQQVEVICRQVETLINETLQSTYDYLKNGKLLVEQLANEFYVNSEVAWTGLSELIEGIEWIIDCQARIDTIKRLNTLLENNDVWNEYIKEITKMKAILPELETAVLQHDCVMIGDLLMYEILPFFEVGEEKLGFLIPINGDLLC